MMKKLKFTLSSLDAGLFSALLSSIAIFCSGCSTDVLQPDKIASFESQNRILREQNAILKNELTVGKDREQKLASRLSQAETELAQQQSNTRR